MKKTRFKFLTLSLFILLAQNMFSAPEIKQGIGTKSVIAGEENEVDGDQSLAFGIDNLTNGTSSSTFGISNAVNGNTSLAFGFSNIITGDRSSAFGFGNKTNGTQSSAFGFQNTANGDHSSALGELTFVSGEGSGAFGRGKVNSPNEYLYKIEGKDSWAIGSYNKIAAGSDSNHILGNNVAIGAGISKSVALGEGSTVNASNVVSVGSSSSKRKIIFVDKGEVSATSSDAITGSQLYEIAKASSADIDVAAWKAKLGVSAGTINAYTKAETDNKLNTKANTSDVYSKAQADNKFADKNNVYAKVETDNKLNTKANKDGSNLSASDVATWKAKLGVGAGSGAVDAYTKAETDNKLNTKANTSDVYSKAQADNKFADKNNVYTKTETDNKLNTKANTSDVYSKAQADSKFADKNNVYTKTETDNKFANKADLDTRAKKDGSNLSASDIATWKAKLATGSVSSIANTAGGTESTGLGHGNVVTGNYSTAVGYKNNVSGNNSGAFGDPNIISGNRSYAVGNDNNIAGDNNFVVGSNVTIAKDVNNSVALGNNSTVSNSNEVSVGSAGKERKITNVADGVISATSTDAVNGRQLFNVANSISAGKTDALRKEFRRENEKVKNEVRQVGSLSAALSALHPLQYDKNKPNQIMAGFGQYRDKSAVAVGMAHYFTENLMMTGGVSLSEGSNTKAMANVGLTWKFGKGGSQETMNTNNMYSVQEEVKRLTVENKKYMAKVTEQQSEIETLKAEQKKMQQQIEMLLNTKK